jgi:hypothetical protein
MKALTTFLIGTAVGIYVDQNYSIPKVTTFVSYGMEWVKKTEETLRKGDGK